MPQVRCPSCGAENDPELDLCSACGRALAGVSPGFVVADRFELLVQVGRGGMGWVFRAHDRLLDDEVAIKVLRSDLEGSHPDAAERFRREIRLARRISHPNVCRIFEYGEEHGLRYITMEFVDGVDLRGTLRRRKAGLPPDEGFGVALGLAPGLAAVHAEGVVHRDLKSGNVMIDAEGVARLMDFGIARDATVAAGEGLTVPGVTMGTPEYMSPEQCHGATPDERSDIYSLGIVCYEIFTGNVPFSGTSALDTLVMQVGSPPPLVEAVERGLPAAMVKPLERALAKDREERYGSVDAFAEALEQARRDAKAERSGRVSSIPTIERRRDRRLEVPLACTLRFAGPSGEPREEQTVTENLSRGGACVKTSQTTLLEGDRVLLLETDGPFEVRAEVRGNRAGEDGVRRLHLKFLDHAAPDRLVGERGDPSEGP